MSKNHAVIVQKAGEAQVQETSIPKLRDDYILVKTKFVALNPTDWKHLDFLTGKGVLLGKLITMLKYRHLYVKAQEPGSSTGACRRICLRSRALRLPSSLLQFRNYQC